MLDRLAELTVAVGANVQQGQDVIVTAELDTLELARAVAAAAYDRGARFVDVWLVDTELKRLRLLHADPETVGYVPPWLGSRFETLAEGGGAMIRLEPSVAPGRLAGIDPALAGRDNLPMLPETGPIVAGRRANWTIVPWATRAWARRVHPQLLPGEGLARLRRELSHVLRLDEDDPVAAWEARLAELDAVAGRLNALELDELRYRGPGTDLAVGLLPGSRWMMARFETRSGITHVPNLPTEEVFTVPDPARVEGVVVSTKPLDLRGTTVDGLRVRFEGGVAVELDAAEGAEALRALTEIDEGARRLGEVALVDDSGRIGPLGTVFGNTLLDENAAGHIALGNGLAMCADGEESLARVNRSKIHVDFMVGSPELTVTGVRRDGGEVELLTGGAWQI